MNFEDYLIIAEIINVVLGIIVSSIIWKKIEKINKPDLKFLLQLLVFGLLFVLYLYFNNNPNDEYRAQRDQIDLKYNTGIRR